MTENWLLLGPEIGKKKEFIEELIKKLEKSSGEAPEIYRFYPFDTDIVDISSSLQTPSLFCSSRVVILYNGEEIKTAGNIKTLNEYISAPQPHTIFIVLSDLSRLSSSSFEKLFTQKKIFWEMNENEKGSYVEMFLKSHNRFIEREAIEEILELVTGDTENLKTVCQNLITFFPENHNIAVDDVDQLIYHSKEESVFSLFDKAAVRNEEASLAVLDKLLQSHQSEPIALIAGLIWQYRKLLSLKRAYGATSNFQQAFVAAGVRGKKSQQIYRKGITDYSTEELQNALALLAECDRNLRILGKSMQKHLIMITLLKIVSRNNIAPASTRF